MSKFDFDEKLKELRELYFEKHPVINPDENLFTPLSLVEKEQKILEYLQVCMSDSAQLTAKIEALTDQNAPIEEINALKDKLINLEEHKDIFEHKLEFIRSGETDDQRKEKLKRQLLDLELKRSKLKLIQKDTAKIDIKIKQKLEIYKKLK